MSKKFKFEIQGGTEVKIEGCDTATEARMKIIETLDDYKDELIQDCCISDGIEVV